MIVTFMQKKSCVKKRKKKWMRTMHEMCVNANHVDDNAQAQHLLYKFGVHSSFFSFCCSVTIPNNRGRNVCHCKNVALLSHTYAFCLWKLLAFVAGNKCYYCLPSTSPANTSCRLCQCDVERTYTQTNTNTMSTDAFEAKQ